MKLRTATLLLTMAAFVPSVGAQQSGSFIPTDDMTSPRSLHRATSLGALGDGRVLITGGISELGVGNEDTAEIFDPMTGAFSLTGSPLAARQFHRTTLLDDGAVLITGGLLTSGSGDAEIFVFDPWSGTGIFNATGSMVTARSGHTATLLINMNPLIDGTVLITGGRSGPTFLSSAEIFDPASETFTTTDSMGEPRHRHTATLLMDGTVLIAGGQDASGTILATAEIFDPEYGTFSDTVGPMTKPRGVDHTATLLWDGTVLLVGGRQLNPPSPSAPTADLYDPVTKTFSEAAGKMKGLRNFHTATLLNDSTVLIAGGRIAETTTTFRAEIYDPLTDTFMETDHMTVERDFHTATFLPDETVLITGGFSREGKGSVIEQSAEIFVP